MKAFKYMLVLIFIAVMLQNCSSDKKSNTDGNYSNKTASKSEVSNSTQDFEDEGSFSSLSQEELKRIKAEEARKKAKKKKLISENERKLKVLEKLFFYLDGPKTFYQMKPSELKTFFERLNKVEIDGYHLSSGAKQYILDLKNKKYDKSNRGLYTSRFISALVFFVAHPNKASVCTLRQMKKFDFVRCTDIHITSGPLKDIY